MSKHQYIKTLADKEYLRQVFPLATPNFAAYGYIKVKGTLRNQHFEFGVNYFGFSRWDPRI